MAEKDRDKKERAKTAGGPRDRDVLVSKATPPSGIPAVTPPTWAAEDTDQHDIEKMKALAAKASTGADDDTPVGLAVADVAATVRMRERIKETNLNTREMKDVVKDTAGAIKSATESTSTEIATFRGEVTGHIERLDKKIDESDRKTNQKLDSAKAEIVGKMDTLTGHVVVALTNLNSFQGLVVENKLQEQTIRVESQAEVAANKQKLADRDQADAKKQRRSFWYRVGTTILKILGGGGVIAITAIATHYAERC